MTQGMTMPTPQQQPQAQAAQQNLINPGVYLMRAIDAELGYTNAKEATEGAADNAPKPQVAILFEFVEGPYKGTSLTWYGFFTEKTKAATFRALRLVGWQGDDLSDLSTARGEAPCVVQNEQDLDGVWRARIRFVGSGQLAMKNVMNDEQKKAFAASMKAFASTIKAPPKEETANGTAGTTGQKFF